MKPVEGDTGALICWVSFSEEKTSDKFYWNCFWWQKGREKCHWYFSDPCCFHFFNKLLIPIVSPKGLDLMNWAWNRFRPVSPQWPNGDPKLWVRFFVSFLWTMNSNFVLFCWFSFPLDRNVYLLDMFFPLTKILQLLGYVQDLFEGHIQVQLCLWWKSPMSGGIAAFGCYAALGSLRALDRFSAGFGMTGWWWLEHNSDSSIHWE